MQNTRRAKTYWMGSARQSGFVATVALTSLLAAPAAARRPGLAALPSLQVRAGELVPGTWVEYALRQRRSGRAVLVRLSALERERDAQWIEIGFTGSRRRGGLVFKVLVRGLSDKTVRVVRAIVQPAGQAPLLIPRDLLRGKLPRFERGPGRAGFVGREKVRVAAGVFTAAHYRHRRDGVTQEAWISSAVKGWPLVKVRTTRSVLELVDHGRSASSQIHGRPIKINRRLLSRLGLLK